jgi:hypothetical protein
MVDYLKKCFVCDSFITNKICGVCKLVLLLHYQINSDVDD